MRRRQTVTMERYREVMVALLESVIRNRLKRPLAEDWRWRHIRLAKKPHYLANHASQIKIYYGTLSGSHGRSYRIRHGKSPETPPGGKITMSSCPIGNKTSLSRKPCIADKKLLWITIMKSWSLSNFFYKKTANIYFLNLSVYSVVNGVRRSHKTANIFF